MHNLALGKSIKEQRDTLSKMSEERKFKGGPLDKTYIKKCGGYTGKKNLGMGLRQKFL